MDNARSPRGRSLRLVVVILLPPLLIAPILAVIMQLPSYWTLQKNSRVAIARIFEVSHDGRRTAHYQFDANDRIEIGSCTRSCANADVGDEIQVYFLESDPSVQSLSDPATVPASILRKIIPSTLFLTLGVWFGLYRWKATNFRIL